MHNPGKMNRRVSTMRAFIRAFMCSEDVTPMKRGLRVVHCLFMPVFFKIFLVGKATNWEKSVGYPGETGLYNLSSNFFDVFISFL